MAAATLTVSTEKREDNLETYSLVWLEPAVNKVKEFIEAQSRLRKLINHLQTFEDVEQCESYIKSVSKENRIIFISNDRLGQEVVPRIHLLRQIFTIYIFKSDNKRSNDWTKNFEKVKGIGMQLNGLVDQILSDQTTRTRTKVDEMFSINIFNTKSHQEKSTTGLNGQFVYSQLLIDRLLSMKPKTTDRNEFISLCKTYYKDNSSELSIIQEFENDYVPNRALWWYTRESFLYRLMNKSLRTQDIDLLFLFRFFIRDIHQQLQELQCSTPLRVYRGQVVSNDELETLKTSLGQFISMNSFLSTSLDRRLALSFLTSSTVSGDFQRVLFEIDLDPTLEGIKPFANITSNSFFADEQEVLIMLGSIFQLVKIDYQDRVCIVQMTLCSDKDNSLKPIYDYMKNEYDDYDGGDTESSVFSFEEKNFQQAFECHQKSLMIRQKHLPTDHPDIGSSVHCIAGIYLCLNYPDLALQYYNKALEIYQKSLPSQHQDIAMAHYNLGLLYAGKEEFQQALTNFQKASSIFHVTLPSTHPFIGIVSQDIQRMSDKLK
ncbi:unnamed protein product [Rotaria socialis]|uniref:NAD(P)(+)--arginine ADP-ribosyltransferase n=1 Tax=Rotaria socialis TaxID=392032 RepID=A0A821A1V0_9BILA|nr:unnamed protein product [Rotaria socialis]